MYFARSIYSKKFGKLTNSSGEEWIHKKPIENSANIKVSTFNNDNIIEVNTNKGDDTDINLLISKNLSEINENIKKNQTANKSESKKVDEINLIDFNEPDINNVEKEKIQGKITATKIAMYFLKLETHCSMLK